MVKIFKNQWVKIIKSWMEKCSEKQTTNKIDILDYYRRLFFLQLKIVLFSLVVHRKRTEIDYLNEFMIYFSMQEILKIDTFT